MGFGNFAIADKHRPDVDETKFEQAEVDDDCEVGLKVISPDTIMERVGHLIISDKFAIRWKGLLVSLDGHTYENRKILTLVLLALVDSPGETITFQELYDEAWVESQSTQSPALAVQIAISQLREAFRAVDENFDQISTSSYGGYFWKHNETAGDEIFGDATINTRSKTIKWKDIVVDIKQGEFEVVEKLMRSSNTTILMPPLYNIYFGKPPSNSRSEIQEFYSIIRGIRQAFRRVDKNFSAIRVMPKGGVRWEDTVAYSSPFSVKPETFKVGRLTLLPREKQALWDEKQVNRNLKQFRMIEALATSRTGRLSSERLNAIALAVPNLKKPGAEDKLMREVIAIVRLFKQVDRDFSNLEIIPGFGYYWRKD